jgi:hypothetical protein
MGDELQTDAGTGVGLWLCRGMDYLIYGYGTGVFLFQAEKVVLR